MRLSYSSEPPLSKPGGHPQWPSDRVAEFKVAYPKEFWSHQALTDILNTAIRFTADESRAKGEYFNRQFDRFHDSVKDIPDVIGIFGTGYPFYAYQDDGSIADIPEIRRYQKSFQAAINRDRLRSYGGWLCGACELACDLPDLKKYCKPCDSVDLKPRDIFKALLDLDYWVVVNDTSEADLRQQEKKIQECTQAASFESSDSNIIQTLETTRYAMETVVSIAPRSLHKVWENTNEPYDFVKDFLFSLTPHTWNDNELLEALSSARHEVYDLIADDPIKAVSDRAEKEKRQLEAPGVAQCLKERINSWK